MSSLLQRKLASKAFDLALAGRARLVDSGRGGRGDTAPEELASGVLDCLSDDNIALVFQFLLLSQSRASQTEATRRDAADVNQRAKASARSTLAASLACRRLSLVFKAQCGALRLEALARLATNIVPASASLSDACFTPQCLAEAASKRHIVMTTAAQKAMACHCARACCSNVHRAFNRELKRGRDHPRLCTASRIVPVAASCAIFSASRDGMHSYVYYKHRHSKRSLHGEQRELRRESYRIVNYENRRSADDGTCSATQLLSIDLQTTAMSEPVCMSCSDCGDFVAFVRTLWADELDGDDKPFSSAFVSFKAGCVEEVPRPTQCLVERPELLSAQKVWFSSSKAGEVVLVVVWSSAYFHPCGQKLGSNQVHSGDAFLVSRYHVERSESGVSVLSIDSSMPHNGTLMDCTQDRSGRDFAALVKTSSVFKDMRSVKLFRGDGAVLNVPTGSSWSLFGPASACLSPDGDCVAAIHCLGDKITLSVSAKTNNSYNLVQNVDISAYFSNLSGHPDAITSDLLIEQLSLSFSPCSRFVAVLDRSALYGQCVKNVSSVVIDTASRFDCFSVGAERWPQAKTLPWMVATEQSPRMIQWTESGLLVAAPSSDEFGSSSQRGGLLLLDAPRAQLSVWDRN